MTDIRYAVVGHHARRELAKSLSEELGAFLAMDEGDLGSLNNHDNAWRGAYAPEADFVVVLEDDVLLVDDFHEHVTRALAALPEEGACSFYTGTGRPRKYQVQAAVQLAARASASWLRADTAYWGPALALPAGRVPEMLEIVQRSDLPYDQRFGAYLRKAGLPCFYTTPSLVDHSDGPSLICDPGIPRRAHQVGIRDSWNKKFVRIM